jgi:hypothetical protein
MPRLRTLILALLPLLFLLPAPAFAKNVPGSAAAVEGRVDRQIASNLIDMTISGAIESTQSFECEQQLNIDARDRNNRCEWGFSAKGEMLYLSDNPSGYNYSSTNGLGTVNISRWISQSTVLVGGVLFEFGNTDTSYNHGDVQRTGAGGTFGIIHHLSPRMAINLFSGVEWLSYEVNRSHGDYQGDYAATRWFADASFSGQAGDDELWLLYRGGMRAISQNNDSYWEEGNSGPDTHVKGVDLFTLSAVADVKAGTTMGDVRPFIHVSGIADLVHDESLGFLGPGIDEQLFTAYTGVGFDADVLDGLVSASSGIYFAEDGYTGFDVRLSYSRNF